MNRTHGLHGPALMDCGSSGGDRKDYQCAAYLKCEVHNAMRVFNPTWGVSLRK